MLPYTRPCDIRGHWLCFRGISRSLGSGERDFPVMTPNHAFTAGAPVRLAGQLACIVLLRTHAGFLMRLKPLFMYVPHVLH